MQTQHVAEHAVPQRLPVQKMKAMDVTKPSPNTWKPKRASYTGCRRMQTSKAPGPTQFGSYSDGAAKQQLMFVTTAYRKEVVEEGQEPPCDIDSNNQREQDSTALQHKIQWCLMLVLRYTQKVCLTNQHTSR